MAKVTFWVIASLLLIIAAVRLSLMTKPVHNLVKNQIEKIARQSLTTGFEIEKINGDLWKEINLSGILIGERKDTVAFVDTAYANYDLLSFLSNEFEVNRVFVKGANANVNQTRIDEDSTVVFNVQEIAKEDTSTQNNESSFAFVLKEIRIEQSKVNINSPGLLPDSSLQINDIELTGYFSLSDEIEAGLQNLGFRIYEGRLPEPVAFRTSGNYQDEIITLEDLVLNTGRSVFNAKGTFNLQDSLTNSDFSMRPLSSKDIAAILNEDLPEEEITLTLGAKGGKENLQLELTANSPNIKNVEVTAKLNLEDKPVLEQFGLRGDGLNIAALTNDSIDVQTGLFQATMDGKLVQDLEAADITWGFTVEGIRYEDYNFRRFFGSGSLKNSKVLANVDITTSGEENLRTNTNIEDVFDENTFWDFSATLSNFNARYWAEGAPDTDIKLLIRAEGEGFELSDKPWEVELTNSNLDPRDERYNKFKKTFGWASPQKLRIGEEEIKYANLSAYITKDSLKATGLTLIEESELNFEAEIADYMSELPAYTFNLSVKNFNADEFKVVEDFPTDLTFKAGGKGKGFSLEDLILNGSVVIDTSYINGAKLDELEAEYSVENGILNIPEASLTSEIADADFNGKRNILDKKDPENILSFDMEIKNTQPFAELANLEILQLKGNLTADINENEEGYLQSKASFDLSTIVLDDMFLADGMTGSADVVMKEDEEADVQLKVSSPQIYETQLQDITFNTELRHLEDSLKGNYSLEIENTESGKIASSGLYEVKLDSIFAKVKMQQLDFITNDNSLKLQNTFTIDYQNGSVQTDSLELVSPNGAFLSLSVPYADSLEQQIWLVGENFDFGILQEIILDERYVDGVLFGQLNIDKKETSLTGNGNLELQNLDYEGVQADIFNFQFNVSDKRLKSELALIWDQEKIISGNLDVPFDLSNPESLSDEFFDQSVSGSFTIAPTKISRFQTVLDKFEITGTEGVLSFDSNLSGTAGTPEFEGLLKITDPIVSDIPLDSIFADVKFSQKEEQLIINSEVRAAKQKAADIDVDFPFSYNFKTFELNTIDENRPVTAYVSTRNFNLAVFNDFLDKQFTKNLKGTLNGNLDIQGNSDKINAEGSFKLEKSSFEVPIAGIKVDGINSEVRFSDDKINLVKLNANSGKGSFSANGSVNLDGVVPTDVNISAKANQFKLANTDEYNLVVDLNSTLSGAVTAPTITGRFAVKNGFIYLDDFGDKTVEDVQLEDEQIETISYYDSLSIDMEFAIERNFFVRNSSRYLEMDVEIAGELDAQKRENDDLSLFGTVEGTGGYLNPLGKRFELEEAQITFSGPPDNPNLNVRSEYIPPSVKDGQEVIIYYVVKGAADEPEFSFESTPPMEQQDIICYTLFNKPCYAFDSWQNAFTSSGGSSPTDLLTGVLLDEIEALATRELGVDVVQIDNTRVGNETGTSIKTGWYLNERTFFAIVNEITSSDPKTLFILEYALSKNLDLILIEGEDSNRRGIDLRWQYDY